MRRYLLCNLIALSQLGNTLLGGYPDESMSARAWRSRDALLGSMARAVIDWFFHTITRGKDRRHCHDAYESEKARWQLPAHYR